VRAPFDAPSWDRTSVSSAWLLNNFSSFLWPEDRAAMGYDFTHLDDDLTFTTAWFLAAIEKRIQAVNDTISHFVHIHF